MGARKEAQDTLIHYFRSAGIQLTNDVDTELRLLVDKIVEAAVDEMFKSRRMRQLLESHGGSVYDNL